MKQVGIYCTVRLNINNELAAIIDAEYASGYFIETWPTFCRTTAVDLCEHMDIKGAKPTVLPSKVVP
jgi:hypothetical protein